MDVHGCAYAHMVAWQSLFLLHDRKTNEVLSRGSAFSGKPGKPQALPEADDVAQR
jgi:hypothetical protein